MKTAVLISLGPRDVCAAEGLSALAARAGVAAEAVVRVDRLAERALKPDAELAAVFSDSASAYVVACSRPRAVRALLDAAGISLPESIGWLPLPFDREALKTEYGVPWYPVIDRTRCTGCGTCHAYCLFSVYAREDKKPAAERIRVAAPLSCKVGCPACARLCPTRALIFPFCQEAELNGEIESPAPRSPDAVAAVLGDDPLRVLAERRKKKQRMIDPEKFEQAEKDRVMFSGLAD